MKTTLSLDARKRITLPPEVGAQPGDLMDLEILEDGCIMLTPIVKIPRHQMWAWSERFDRKLAEVVHDRAAKVRASDPGVLEDLAKSLKIKH